jgi:ADP-ribose pyrophosphatase
MSDVPTQDDLTSATDTMAEAVEAFVFDGDRSESDCHVSGEPLRRGLVLGEEDPRDASLAEKPLTEDVMWTGRIFNVNRLRVELPDGRQALRDVVRHPGAVAVVALTDDGRICLVRQYRT